MAKNNPIPILHPGFGAMNFESETDMWCMFFCDLWGYGRVMETKACYMDAVSIITRFTPFKEGYLYERCLRAYMEYGQQEGKHLGAFVTSQDKRLMKKDFLLIAAALSYAANKEFDRYAAEDGFYKFLQDNKL